jgi:hypothetical protein
MKRFLLLGVFATLIYAPVAANAAQPWGLNDEEIVRFDATVVDLLCELTGDCPENCGDGKRQLGLIDGSGKLIPVFKNVVAFAGAAAELIGFCGKTVTADGLFSTNRGTTIFSLQFVREAPDGKWRKANRFLIKWAEDNGVVVDSNAAKTWFRNDPRVKALIAK